MKYRRLLAPTIVVPKQEPGHTFWQSQALPEFSVVGVQSNNQPSPITGKKNELTVKWKDVSGKEIFGWIAKNTPMDDKMSKKELSRGVGDLRVSAWDTVRKRISSAPGWTAKSWICRFADTNLPLLHAVIRELGGKVPKTDDIFAATSRAIKLITGQEITMKEVEEVRAKNAPKKSKKNKKAAAAEKTSTKKEKGKSSKKSKSSKRNGAGRVSEFAGKTIVRLQKENPRREGSQGWKSWSVIKKGMTYEEFIKAGGSRGSLAKEIKNKRIKLR